MDKALEEIIEKHRKWVNQEGGERADLHDIDLSGVDLCEFAGC